ncbi:MAG: outer membrane beta-barrel protein [Bacteroidia bacterium]
MKKIIFLASALTAFSFVSKAQFTKGEVELGLGLSVSNSHSYNPTSSNSSSSFNTFNAALVPDISYFVSDKWVIGTGLIFSLSQAKGTDVSGSNSTSSSDNINSIGIAPFVRRYYKMGDKVAVFAQMGFSLAFGGGTRVYSNSSTATSTSTELYKTTDFGLGFAPGINYALSERWILEASTNFFSLDFTTKKYPDGSPNSTSSNLNFTSLPNSIMFGIKVILHK